jgi:hypothetical protein
LFKVIAASEELRLASADVWLKEARIAFEVMAADCAGGFGFLREKMKEANFDLMHQ